MALYEFEGRKPNVGKDVYISPSANLIGDVRVGDGCFIGPGAQIKGDYGTIIIGAYTSVQENCVLHTRPDTVSEIGCWVTVGHGAVLHGCTIQDYAVIGMGSIISDFSNVGVWAAVGEGCVVRSKQVVEDGNIVVGIPAKVIGSVSEDYKEQWTGFKKLYVELAKRYIVGLKKISD